MQARRALLADAANEMLGRLYRGESVEVVGSGSGVDDEPEMAHQLEGLSDWCAENGLARLR